MVNLRQVILQNRLQVASSKPTEKEKKALLARSIQSLRRCVSFVYLWITLLILHRSYFFLIAFSAFVSESDISFEETFAQWIARRDELTSMMDRLRKSTQMWVFTPVHDLSSACRQLSGTYFTG